MMACDFPGARRIGAPRDWDQSLDGSCGVVFVTDAVDTQSGLNFMYSVYKPTEADLEVLNAGGCLRLGFAGHGHPVFNMSVLGPEIVKTIEINPMWDLGSPIL